MDGAALSFFDASKSDLRRMAPVRRKARGLAISDRCKEMKRFCCVQLVGSVGGDNIRVEGTPQLVARRRRSDIASKL